jgi:hypothetical protein
MVLRVRAGLLEQGGPALGAEGPVTGLPAPRDSDGANLARLSSPSPCR